MNIELLQKVATRHAKDATHLQYLKYLYNDVKEIETIDDLVGIGNFSNISFDKEIELEIALNMLASKLTFDNKIAIRLYQTKNQLIVETN